MCIHRPRFIDYFLIQFKRNKRGGMRETISSWQFCCKKCGKQIRIKPKWVTAKFIETIILLVSIVWICRLGLYLLDLLVKGNITLIYEIIFSGFFSLVVYFCIDSLFFLFIKYEVIEDTH